MSGEAKLDQPFGRTPKCPSIECLDDYVSGALSDRGLKSCYKHIEECPACQAEAVLLERFYSAVSDDEKEETDVTWMTAQLAERSAEIFPMPAAEVSGRQEGFWTTFLNPLTMSWASWAVAALLLVVAGTLYLPNGERFSEPGFGPEVRSSRLRIVAPNGDLDKAPTHFEWRDDAGAVTYRVQIFDVDHSLVWQETTSAQRLEIPVEVRRQMLPGKRLRWQVIRLDSLGRPSESSQERSFQVVVP